MNYVRPDQITTVPIQGGELKLSVGYDVIHTFRYFGASILKYWSPDGVMCNVMLNDDTAVALSEASGLMIVERPFMLASEHESLVTWRADNLSEGDFEL